jgi:predicted dehydrogenase
MNHSRRNFLRNTSFTVIGSGVLAAVPMEVLARIRRYASPNERINIGLIGCKGMGWSNLTAFLKLPEVNCAAICDIDDAIIEQRKADLAKININPAVYKDYRKLLANKDIDAVIIATPDHWHCLQMIDACAAGKDVYVEKPAANSIREAQLMVAAAKKYNRVVQVNQWQRSQDHFKNAIDFVRSGKLGRISFTKTWMHRSGSVALPVVADEAVPPGVDYDMWLGPAPKKPFNKNRFHYEFRWFWDYAGGLMTDWGVHLIDMVLMGMNVDLPKSVIASGGKYVFPTDVRETPDLQMAVYDYGNFTMTWEHTMGSGTGNYGLNHGIAFLGENGTLILNRSGWEVKPEKAKDIDKINPVAFQPRTDNGLEKHVVNFVEVMRNRKTETLACGIEAGARVAINCHMANIALRSRTQLLWNRKKNEFSNQAANLFLSPVYHNGWKLPKL